MAVRRQRRRTGNLDYPRFIKRVELPADFAPPTTMVHEGIVATALTRDDLADDVRGINASLDLINRTRGGGWPTEPVTEAYDYVDLVCTEMLEVAAPHARWIDAFCETGAFTAEQSRRVLGAGRAADLRFIESVARTIAEHANGPKIIVEKSTIPVKTAETIKEILRANTEGHQFEVLSNPEFLAEGTAVADLLADGRLVEIVGPGGVGKTRLALHVGAALIDMFPDGVWLVELARTRDPAAVPGLIADQLGLDRASGGTGGSAIEYNESATIDAMFPPSSASVRRLL